MKLVPEADGATAVTHVVKGLPGQRGASAGEPSPKKPRKKPSPPKPRRESPAPEQDMPREQEEQDEEEQKVRCGIQAS